MNQLDKNQINSTNPSLNPVLQEKILYLEARIKSLSDLCNELNPYAEISNDLKLKLLNYNIVDLSDPFKITNQLLIFLEDAIDDLHMIKPFNENDYEVKEIL